MASIADNNILKGVSGALGRTIILKKYRKRTIVSGMPSRPRKRSAAQKKNAENFRIAAKYSRMILNDPDIKEFYKQKALEHGQNSAYIAALKDYLLHQTFVTKEYILEQARLPVTIAEPPDDSEDIMEIKVVTTSGDIIAQGFAVRTDTDHWKYLAPFTGVEVTVRYGLKKK